MIYRVVVLCEGFKNAAKTKLVRDKIKVLVGAADADEAFTSAVQWVEMNAPMGPKWKSFTALEAAPLYIPIFVANI